MLSCAGAVVVACGSSDSSSSSSGGTGDGGLGDGSGGEGGRGNENTGQECTTAATCYGGVDGGADGGAISGEVVCLTKVTNGYCTHKCNDDSDCCKAAGECKTGLKQVCASFENTSDKYCFLSCEDSDVKAGFAAQDAGIEAGTSQDAYCHSFASTAIGCRSTGGGSKNRKACLP